jgi:hypothetical protein
MSSLDQILLTFSALLILKKTHQRIHNLNWRFFKETKTFFGDALKAG